MATTISLLRRDSAFHNELGLFLVDDASGRIGNLHPGNPGYTHAALLRRQLIFTRDQAPGAVRRLSLPSGSYLGLYLVQNSSSQDWLFFNRIHQLGRRPNVFFSFQAANSDRFGHILSPSTNRYALEDMTYGGDKDFNDLVADFQFVDSRAAKRNQGSPHK